MQILWISRNSGLVLALSSLAMISACKPSDRDGVNATDNTPAVPAAQSKSSEPANDAPVVDANAVEASKLSELTEAQRSTRFVAVGRCMLETINGEKLIEGEPLLVQDKASATIVGWVGDPTTGAWPQSPQLRIEQLSGPRIWTVGLGDPVARPGVAKLFKLASMELTGFKARMDLSALPADTYRLSIVYDNLARSFACNRQRTIRIGG
jgi:hypothetical protein